MKTPRFLKLMGYETKRIFRNRVVFGMLLVFCVVLICSLYFVQAAADEYVVAVYSDGIEDITEQANFQIMEKKMATKTVYVDSEEQGIDLLKRGDAIFFIRFTKEEKGPASAVVYYDASNTVIGNIVDECKNIRDKYAYERLMDYLKEWGVKMKSTYFNSLEFRQIASQYGGEKKFTYDQLAFGLEIAASISLILLLGLAYSLARDRETGVGKNVSYIPIGHNTYFLSKVVPFFLLGMLEMLLLCGLGSLLLRISFQINLFLVWALSAFFVMATISLGLLFSMMKNQISSVFFGILAVLLPIFIEILVVVPALPTALRVLINILPVTPYLRLFNGMVYNGIILWWTVPVLFAQAVVYYLAALFVIKKQS